MSNSEKEEVRVESVDGVFDEAIMLAKDAKGSVTLLSSNVVVGCKEVFSDASHMPNSIYSSLAKGSFSVSEAMVGSRSANGHKVYVHMLGDRSSNGISTKIRTNMNHKCLSSTAGSLNHILFNSKRRKLCVFNKKAKLLAKVVLNLMTL